jgi:hypothetical protein
MSTSECKVSREKHWHELDQDGKIERLSEYVFRQTQQLESIRDGLKSFARHKHMPDGEIVLPLDRNGGVLGSGGNSYLHDALRRQE